MAHCSNTDYGRRALLNGRLRPTNELRPPWSAAEDQFVDLCTRCGDCIDACKQHIIRVGCGGFAIVNFSGAECTFCSACVDICKTDALSKQHNHLPWQYKASINNACLASHHVECRSCADACEHQAIRFFPDRSGISQPILKTGLCNGCGACVSVCPTRAINILSGATHYESTTTSS